MSKIRRLNATAFEHTWRVGQRCVKIFYGLGGYREAKIVTITDVDASMETIFVDNGTGVTFDCNGKEKENFFPPARAEITPLGSAT